MRERLPAKKQDPPDQDGKVHLLSRWAGVSIRVHVALGWVYSLLAVGLELSVYQKIIISRPMGLDCRVRAPWGVGFRILELPSSSPMGFEISEFATSHFLYEAPWACQFTPGPPVRASELLSVTWRNTARQRHLLMWERLVVLYVQYHKGQQQSGVYKDNIRFLPKAIGDLRHLEAGQLKPLDYVQVGDVGVG